MKFLKFFCCAALFAMGFSASGALPETLNVISYNIQARPLLDNASAKVSAIGKRLTEFDLVGIQELFVGASGFASGAEGMNFRYFEPKSHAFKIVNSGLAILSKYPVEKTAQEYFENEGSFENVLASKGVYLARIRIAGRIVDFYTTHMAAGREKDSGAARKDQSEQILRFIQKNSPPAHAVILTGDFNWRLPKLKLFSQIGLQSVAEELKCEKNTRIDHIFYRSGKTLQLTPVQWNVQKESFQKSNGDSFSDHDPVQAIFQIRYPDPSE